MQGLRRFRTLFARRREPVVIDLSETQAGGLVEGPDAALAEPSGANGASRGALATIEPKPPTRRPTLAEVQRSYDEVMDLVRRIGEHIDTQAQRTDTLIGLLNDLPRAIQALPEINRNNARMIECLTDFQNQAKRRDEALSATLGTVGQSSQRQTEVLGLIQQQLDSSSASAAQTGDTLDQVRQTLRDLSSSNVQTSRVLSQIADEGRMRENKLESLVESTRTWIIIALAACVIASLGAVGVAVFAIVAA